jgi:Ca-activated chloride channel family protein
MERRLRWVCLILLLFGGFVSQAQLKKPKTRILFVLDASGSMYARMGNDNRINTAKRLLSQMVDSLRAFEEVELALRVYGHTSPKEKRNCEDTRLEVPFSWKNHDYIIEEMHAIRPKGTTLIAYSLQQAAYDFPLQAGVRNIIILITDGIEECDGDPCAVSKALQEQGVALKPFIIGVGLDEQFRNEFDCVGRYFEANTEAAFEEVLGIVITQALNNTTAQVNLLDDFGQATETDVNMTFYDHNRQTLEYNFIHTINDRGVPDTLYLDPGVFYDLVIHTIPPIEKNKVEIKAGKHNVIPVDAGQGSLKLEIDGITNYNRLIALIKDPKTNEVIHFQDFNTQQKYLTGKYDIEILSTPRIKQEGLSISQDKITTLKIPQPGKLNLITRIGFIGGIYRIRNNEMEWVCNIDNKQGRQLIVIQPGTYYLITRNSLDKDVLKTKQQKFTIQSGQVTQIALY